jgi:hypothetical protein
MESHDAVAHNGYYTWAKLVVGFYAASFLFYGVVWVVRRPPDGPSLTNYPLVTLGILSILCCLFVGLPVFVWAAHEDRRYRAERVQGVTAATWYRIAVLTLLTYGLYAVWFVLTRKTRPLQRSGADDGAATGGPTTRPAAGPTSGTDRDDSGTRVYDPD